MNKSLKAIIKTIFGIGIIIFLIFKVGLTNLWSSIINFNFLFLPLLVAVFCFLLIVNSFNVLIVLNALNNKISFRKVLRYYLKGWVYGLITPARLGEISIIYFLKKEKIEIGQSALVLLLDKVLTFICFFLVSLFGLFTFFHFKEALLLVSIILILFLVFVFFVVSEIGRSIIKRLILRKHSISFAGFSENMFYLFKKKKKIIFLNIIVTYFRLVVTSLFFYLTFIAFGGSARFLTIAIIIATTTIISLIPVSISGLGIRESSGVLLFLKYGVTTSLSTSVFLFYTILRYILAAIFQINMLLNTRNRKVYKS